MSNNYELSRIFLCTTRPEGNWNLIQVISDGLLWIALVWVSFYVCWPLVFIALVPFARLAVGASYSPLRSVVVWLIGAVYFAVLEYWFALYSLAALLTLAALQSLTLLPVAMALHFSSRRNIPLSLSLPVFWVAGEYLRTLGPFGFPNGALAPALFRKLTMIQIADVGGIFVVSFAVAAVSGALFDIWRAYSVARRWDWSAFGRNAGAVATLWLLILGYGYHRLAESQKTAQLGPWVAVIQPDVPYASDVGEGYDPIQFSNRLMELSRQAAGHQPSPALIVWPESSLLPPLNEEFWQADANQIQRTVEFARRVQGATDSGRLHAWLEKMMQQGKELHQRIQAFADELNVSLLVGAPMRVPYPEALDEPWRSYNAAFFFRPHLAVTVQKKVHLFPMRERIPFMGTWAEAPFRWLATVTGAQPEFELDPGADLRTLEVADGGAKYPFTAPICGEIDLARTAGVFRADGEPRFIVNISDDGSFQRSAMLRVRQSMLAYRAVESRSSLVRSVNTGVSCFVLPTGEIYGAVRNARGESWTGKGFPERSLIAEVMRRKASGAGEAEVADLVAEIHRVRAEAGIEGYSVQRVDLDSRRTVYSRIGDLFAQVCAGIFGFTLLAGTFRAFRHLPSRRVSTAG